MKEKKGKKNKKGNTEQKNTYFDTCSSLTLSAVNQYSGSPKMTTQLRSMQGLWGVWPVAQPEHFFN